MHLSVCILTQGEPSLSAAVDSVKEADEIILVCCAETKLPMKLTKGMKKVVSSISDDFSQARNVGLTHARHGWVLFLDSDEVVTPALWNEIQDVISREDHNSCYQIPRRDFFWDRELKFGETARVRSTGLIRLIKQNSGVWKGRVHEEFITTHRVGKLHAYIDHKPHQTITAFLRSINHYSDLRASELVEQGERFSLFKLCVYPVAKFVYTYGMKLGWCDGAAGFVYSFMMSFHSFLARAKMLRV